MDAEHAKAVGAVKRHFAPHDPDSARLGLSRLLEDMQRLCEFAIKDYERDVDACFDQWKHTSLGRSCCNEIGEKNVYLIFLAGANWRPPKQQGTTAA